METSAELELEFTIMRMHTFQHKGLPSYPSKTKCSLDLKLENGKAGQLPVVFWNWEVFI